MHNKTGSASHLLGSRQQRTHEGGTTPSRRSPSLTTSCGNAVPLFFHSRGSQKYAISFASEPRPAGQLNSSAFSFIWIALFPSVVVLLRTRRVLLKGRTKRSFLVPLHFVNELLLHHRVSYRTRCIERVFQLACLVSLFRPYIQSGPLNGNKYVVTEADARHARRSN